MQILFQISVRERATIVVNFNQLHDCSAMKSIELENYGKQTSVVRKYPTDEVHRCLLNEWNFSRLLNLELIFAKVIILHQSPTRYPSTDVDFLLLSSQSVGGKKSTDLYSVVFLISRGFFQFQSRTLSKNFVFYGGL